MKKIIVEVGSTVTKVDEFDGEKVKNLQRKTIEFKRHFNEDKRLKEADVNQLIEIVNGLKEISDNIYVCGTSIFRDLDEVKRNEFLDMFKKETGYDFSIISQEKENELTVYGATRFVNDKVCVFIGGGGSTEISIYDKGIKENANSPIGVVEVMQHFPDLADDLATTDIEEVKTYVKERIKVPTEKADILILSGGAHKRFAIDSGLKVEKNTLYNDESAPIMMDIETRKSESERYYKEISLDEIRNRVNDPQWWYATRAMCAVVLVVAEAIGAKYVVPTDIAMVYGLLSDKNEDM